MKFIFNLSRQRLQRKKGGVASEWEKMAKLIQNVAKQCRKISTCLAQSVTENVSVRVKSSWIGTKITEINNIRKCGGTPKPNLSLIGKH